MNHDPRRVYHADNTGPAFVPEDLGDLCCDALGREIATLRKRSFDDLPAKPGQSLTHTGDNGLAAESRT